MCVCLHALFGMCVCCLILMRHFGSVVMFTLLFFKIPDGRSELDCYCHISVRGIKGVGAQECLNE